MDGGGEKDGNGVREMEIFSGTGRVGGSTSSKGDLRLRSMKW